MDDIDLTFVAELKLSDLEPHDLPSEPMFVLIERAIVTGEAAARRALEKAVFDLEAQVARTAGSRSTRRRG